MRFLMLLLQLLPLHFYLHPLVQHLAVQLKLLLQQPRRVSRAV